MHTVDADPASEAFKRRSVGIVQFMHGHMCQELFDFLSGFCDMVAVGRCRDVNGVECFSAVLRRTGFTRIPDEQFGVVQCFAPRVQGLRSLHAHELNYEFFHSWSRAQVDVMSNFVIMSSNVINADVILAEWHGRELFHVLADIQKCKSTVKADRDERQRYVADHAARLEQMWKAMTTPNRKRSHVETGDETIPDSKTCV